MISPSPWFLLYMGSFLVWNSLSFLSKSQAYQRHFKAVLPAYESNASMNFMDDCNLCITWISDTKKQVQIWDDAYYDCYMFLFKNLMPFDLINAASLGFHVDIEHSSLPNPPSTHITEVKRRMFLPDGLSNGIANITIYMALETKVRYPWTQLIPRDVFMEYVLPFAVVNEARTNWRPIVHDAIRPTLENLIHSNATVEDVVRHVNRDLWTALGKVRVSYDVNGNPFVQRDPIVFKAGQTPLVYDPISIMQFGFGSCTGLSILLINALRCAGIPARLVGTPAWNGCAEKGNHNWIEVYSVVRKDWVFMEPAYGDYGTDKSDHMDRDPCSRWFCNRAMFETTQVFAARYDREKSGTVIYPMAWDTPNSCVPGVERTQYYQDICSKC